jgi:hypothetical protein
MGNRNPFPALNTKLLQSRCVSSQREKSRSILRIFGVLSSPPKPMDFTTLLFSQSKAQKMRCTCHGELTGSTSFLCPWDAFGLSPFLSLKTNASLTDLRKHNNWANNRGDASREWRVCCNARHSRYSSVATPACRAPSPLACPVASHPARVQRLLFRGDVTRLCRAPATDRWYWRRALVRPKVIHCGFPKGQLQCLEHGVLPRLCHLT